MITWIYIELAGWLDCWLAGLMAGWVAGWPDGWTDALMGGWLAGMANGGGWDVVECWM